MLTDGVSRNNGVNWNKNGTKFAYVSTRRDSKSNDIWLMDPLNPEASEILMESPDGSWWGVIDWSSDNKNLLVLQYISASDSRIHILNVETKEIKQLVGDKEAPSVNFPYSFDAKNNGFFFTTNQYSEFNQLAYKAYNKKDPVVITKDINWNIDSGAITKKKDRAAFIVNADGIDTLYLLNPKNF